MKATLQTLGAIVGVFLLQMLTVGYLDQIPLSFYTLANPVIDSQPWAIVLSVYSHAGAGHLVGNAVALLILGIIVERVTTVARFHLFFLVTGIIAGTAEVLFWLFVGSASVSVLGASGAIFGLMGYAVIGNDLAQTFIEKIDLGRKGTLLMFAVLSVGITYLTASQGVALVAHATGFFVGAVAGRFKILHTETPKHHKT